MARKRTGLSNRFRSGRSTYSIKGKGKNADKYGSYTQGRIQTNESIAGRSISEDLSGAKRKVVS